MRSIAWELLLNIAFYSIVALALTLIIAASINAVTKKECIILGVVHVNDAPLLYKDCDGSIIREWLWVEREP